MRTSEYPHFQCSFAEFNPVQEACFPFFTQDCNLVVGSTTSSGKTAVAECIFGHSLESGSVCYISPLKALSKEKYLAWKKKTAFGKKRIALLSGDASSSAAELKEAELIVSTLEAANVRLRKGERWLLDLKCLVLDEAHLIGSGQRGAGAEALLMGFTKVNPNCRVVLLSATMGNARDVAKWLKSLNGKQTKLVHSEWRPKKIEKSVEPVANKSDASEAILQHCMEDYPYRKILLFVHSKTVGRQIAKFLSDSGLAVAFYSADLSASRRATVEKKFRSKNPGSLPILVSTSALSMGINL